MTPRDLALAWSDWWRSCARWCRACGWDAEARECTRAADWWLSIAERMDR